MCTLFNSGTAVGAPQHLSVNTFQMHQFVSFSHHDFDTDWFQDAWLSPGIPAIPVLWKLKAASERDWGEGKWNYSCKPRHKSIQHLILSKDRWLNCSMMAWALTNRGGEGRRSRVPTGMQPENTKIRGTVGSLCISTRDAESWVLRLEVWSRPWKWLTQADMFSPSLSAPQVPNPFEPLSFTSSRKRNSVHPEPACQH